jgi:quinol monooxygenase YgiN
MIRKLFIFAVRPEQAERFSHAAAALVTDVALNEPGTTYEVYRAPGEACFYHYAVFADGQAHAKHLNSAHHAAFDAVAKALCTEPEKAVVLEKIAST